jgi:hypothetical protein
MAVFFTAEAMGAGQGLTSATDVVIEYDTASGGIVAAAVAKNEYREKLLINKFRFDAQWMNRIPNKSQWVNQDVIRLNSMGADPTVLIDNNTYPIPVNSRTDSSQAISLFKYETDNTVITDDEVYALPYDKAGSVQTQHRETIEEAVRMHALHSLAPSANTTETPIIETSGANNGNGGKRLLYADVIKLATKLDKLKVPRSGRVLVLSSEHAADLILEDKGLQVQYHNHSDGLISKNFAGFELYVDIYSPKYTSGLEKIAYGASTAGQEASIVFHAAACAKARGSVKVYLRDSKLDPENREAVMGARLYALAIPTRALGQAAIVTGTVA